MNDSPETLPEANSSQKNRLSRFFLVVCCIGGLIFLAHSWKSSQPVAEIAVVGTEALTANEVLSALDMGLRTQAVEKIPLALVQQAVEKNPLVKNAVVERRGVRGIEIQVEERVPVAALIRADGSTILIDNEATMLPYSRFKDRADVPLIRGVMEKGKVDSGFLKDAMTILQHFESNRSLQLISEIEFNRATRAYSIISDLGVDIYLGDHEVLQNSLKKLSSLLKNQGKNSNIFQKTEYIDLRWKGRIITRARKTDA